MTYMELFGAGRIVGTGWTHRGTLSTREIKELVWALVAFEYTARTRSYCLWWQGGGVARWIGWAIAAR
jgi:hypothetical protein